MAEWSARVQDGSFDVAIIGGGVVGCAAFREFVLAGARCVLVERDADLINGASKGNSGLLHTGFDAAPGSVEAKCMRLGYRAYLDIRERLNLPLLSTGAVLTAWSADDERRLPLIVAHAHKNGVGNVREISRDELLRREPALSRRARGAVLVPGESVIDPWSAPLAYALQGLLNGGMVVRGAEVTGGALQDGLWRLATSRGEIRARAAVNCAGTCGDLVEAIARPSPFVIRPRKGQFVVFDKSAYGLVRSIVLPVPNERTKGVLVSRTAFGNLIVGPTAEDQDDRRMATVDRARLADLIEQGNHIVPGLSGHPVTAAYAGLRPAIAGAKDYVVEALPERRWLTASGIRSTGLTAALGIARRLRELYETNFGELVPLADPVWPRVPESCRGASASRRAGRPFGNHLSLRERDTRRDRGGS